MHFVHFILLVSLFLFWVFEDDEAKRCWSVLFCFVRRRRRFTRAIAAVLVVVAVFVPANFRSNQGNVEI